jgi:hypothetical protein
MRSLLRCQHTCQVVPGLGEFFFAPDGRTTKTTTLNSNRELFVPKRICTPVGTLCGWKLGQQRPAMWLCRLNLGHMASRMLSRHVSLWHWATGQKKKHWLVAVCYISCDANNGSKPHLATIIHAPITPGGVPSKKAALAGRRLVWRAVTNWRWLKVC